MEKLKVMTIVGTRPEIIRLSATIKACDKYFNQVLVHTGQNYDYTLNQVFFEELELREPNHYLNAVGSNLGETMGNIISKSYEVLLLEQPDALLILGDTNSCLSAVAAKRLKIPVFHMEAGNRCFDQNVPEEINRKIVDHVSDVNLPYTEHSRRYLLDEGFKKENIFVTGSPMKEVLENYKNKIDQSKVLEKLKLTKQKYILVSAHREENIDNEENFNSLMNALNDIAEKYKIPVIYSTHPRSWKKIEERDFKFHPLVKQLKPFGFFDYNALQKNAFVVLSDSGTLSEESSILKFPGVLIRTSTERPEVLDKGTIIIGGIKYENLIQSVELARAMFKNNEQIIDALDYKDTNVSQKVVKIIQSYTEIINRNTWRK
ncbi:non-hydrolyzing UDP-N-acetylglucosamine 2-epimerase [Staphylococcus saprophyticus]|uniref:non-hydrolyzing UDP-N-acetylglucosamine 2-epimerase n=1 Tax=Staphylococcus saprophyticus TaxID=29385 RepID=UPI000FF88DE5|nr:UDP-N-acetylglucosamine 2-epimerase (non-hydrolyzing) [Staphylococcus saprophyticus]MDW4099694.1 UDP-N-acetylglucosamine 2-epimerase (non-hydrolyzing) [Staphylococcus saprophyticus]MDW4158944.1 UDP-N-acetylglucosamine 2-epimerase (non-hydrolyzing) [Staphylococcus saprophyticus]MDW4161883.1 UDP-N-acetylglucosamine 2-epimerase (non-hydrolyzing) [Staphylococcus saprophyticus]MDW4423664.1 UDP-N-acetylglucosamine 2-epimerase (non-hydrolyzing) [Staphylococcus saprophyticus]MDW4433149.1 UDP-N-acet